MTKWRISEVLSIALEASKRCWPTMLGALLIIGLVGSVAEGLQATEQWPLIALAVLLNLASYWMQLGFMRMSVMGAAGGRPSLEMLFDTPRIRVLRALGVLVGLLLFMGIPGAVAALAGVVATEQSGAIAAGLWALCLAAGVATLFIWLRLFFIVILVADQDVHIEQAFRRCWSATQGQVMRLLALALIYILLMLPITMLMAALASLLGPLGASLAVVIFIPYFAFALLLINFSLAAVYRALLCEQGANNA